MTLRGLPEGARLITAGSIDCIEEPSNAALVFPLARLNEGASSVSVTKVSINGRHRSLSSRRSTRLYVVLEGELEFVLNRSATVVVASSDSLVIPRGCVYSLEGTAVYLVINTPSFEDGDDIYVE